MALLYCFVKIKHSNGCGDIATVVYLGFCEGEKGGLRQRHEVRCAGGAVGLRMGVPLPPREGSGQGAVPLPDFF